ncbi:MAG: phosphoesterase [Acidobacteria bacterium]|nr:phosphoesterase [Acidobacteriota bacterium]
MTTRLYYGDSYQTSFDAAVIAVEDGRAYLDRTAFYPASGGQPADTGFLGTARVTDVIDEGGRIAHAIEGGLSPGPVQGAVDWTRRFDHMQQHTGQHLLSAVLAEDHGIPTISFHLGSAASTIDVEAASLDPGLVATVERRVNERVFENHAVTVSYHECAAGLRLRKPPDREGTIRVVSIGDLDHSACGGTHVRSTAEIGPILLRRLDKIRGSARIEFLCGLRAVSQARADYQLLTSAARAFSSANDQVPALAASMTGRLNEAGKVQKRLATELAQLRGAELARSTAPNSRGWLVHSRRLTSDGIGDDVRTEAQAFAAAGRALFVAASAGGAILAAASSDGPCRAGDALKSVVAAHGGRGGGSPVLAQGSVPPHAVDEAIRALLAATS